MKNKKIFLLIILVAIFLKSNVQAQEIENVMNTQKDTVGVSDFIEKSNEYTSDVFSDMDLNEILSSAITGNTDKSELYKGILKIFGNELESAITMFGSIVVIIIILMVDVVGELQQQKHY